MCFLQDKNIQKNKRIELSNYKADNHRRIPWVTVLWMSARFIEFMVSDPLLVCFSLRAKRYLAGLLLFL